MWWPSVDAVVERAQLAARMVRYNVDVKNAAVASLVLHDYVFPAARFVIAITVLDTWQYFLHRAMHLNKWLYRTFHSRHHRLYVPYAYGALYNHPIEGLLLDTIGAGLGFLVSGMSVGESVFFFTFSTLKTVDDHCGYNFPWDPLQIFFPNNSQYHDIHHQSYGIKRNFSQPYFTFWDKVLGTHMSAEEIPKKLKLTKTGVKFNRKRGNCHEESNEEASRYGCRVVIPPFFLFNHLSLWANLSYCNSDWGIFGMVLFGRLFCCFLFPNFRSVLL
ncbi:hypothetical protein SAICODRAFT_199062 [Saitoella complicata NRRL Y-17804]|uniref:uncharacterized protein n=1 Tax=Saitoella complicata (strain BCRC 22490 / CBS 7301 / JCM 7358 / NBRC 10748 / NRRL Y-17804) TaxID=698492 RepID=UPI00086822AF|nr:uncharacterized protein SAICODRAFT_199062 [Saitoella complicata NRRL Y-17804]ODQ55072.1 hypothetical protein SAICODRAFT_199062 [Saitoella complicata NRRL Y-17804]